MILRRASDGSRVRLGPELGRGGEGAVYPVIADTRVAKIYFKAPTPAKVEKLRVMTRAATPALLRVAAWPVDLLVDESQRVRGFLMPRVAAREDAHQLYSPRSRRRAFPDADFRFIVRAAANVARAFAQVHVTGHVIGDVNHGNALIGKDATVVLIDCDSFQIRDRGGRVFTCDVGVPLFTAPELQEVGFRGLRRSARHDSFGLAVLLFHLLYLGRHPFAGRYIEGELPIERAIAESRFAYGASASARGMSAPPATLKLEALGADIAGMFERAFAAPGDAQRPAATEWIAALQALEQRLTACAVSPTHFHPRDNSCCWCAFESQAGLRVFGPATLIEGISDATLQTLWSAIKAVRQPSRDLLFPPAFSTPAGLQRWVERTSRDGFVLAKRIAGYGFILLTFLLIGFFGEKGLQVWIAAMIVGSAVMYGIGAWRTRVRKMRRAREGREFAAAELAWKRAVDRWNELCSSALFNREVLRLKTARQELANLARGTDRKKRNLQRELQEFALERYLDDFRIDHANLDLRRPEISVLSSFGFETAADVISRSGQLLHMIRSSKANEILSWARTLQTRFRFEPTEPRDPRLVAALEQRQADRQRELLATLRAGPETLERTRREIEEARARMEPAMDAARAELRAASDNAMSGFVEE